MASTTAKSLSNIAQGLQSASTANSAQSQQFSREQMAFQQASNEQAMAFSAQEAQKNRDWQEKMSNTAHQREVKDLIAAGLNPVLSANGGATTPSGGSGSGFSSSGASGQTDNSYINAIANIYAQQMQQQTNLDIAKINQQTQLETARLGYDATLATANISAQTQKSVNNANLAWSERQAKYYPSSLYGSAGALGQHLNDLYNNITSGLNSGKATKSAVDLGNKIKSVVSNYQKRIKAERS